MGSFHQFPTGMEHVQVRRVRRAECDLDRQASGAETGSDEWIDALPAKHRKKTCPAWCWPNLLAQLVGPTDVFHIEKDGGSADGRTVTVTSGLNPKAKQPMPEANT